MKCAGWVLGMLLASFVASGPALATDVTVDIRAFTFEPREITVTPGSSVTWVNRDQTIHNVVSREGPFRSAGMDTDDRFTFRFGSEGDFTYLCALHPHMTGTVHVRAH